MSQQRGDAAALQARVRASLLRCVDWSRAGRHRRVLSEIEGLLPWASREPRIEAELLVWKAQALLAMAHPERALPAAARSWELAASPHACHLEANALCSLGNADEAEELMRVGWTLFPEAANLPIQLAMMLTEQGRLPEALDILHDVTTEHLPDDIQVFLFGLRANLMATVGRWRDARETLAAGLGLHPGSTVLNETRESLQRSWNRNRAEHELVASWTTSLEPLDGVGQEVDEAIVRCGAVTERAPLVVLAARRLWRSFTAAKETRVQAPDPWAAALVLAVMEIDGQQPSASAMARALGVSPSTVRSALRRVRAYVAHLEPLIARRSFAGINNPRLDQPPATHEHACLPGTLIPFPEGGASADTR